MLSVYLVQNLKLVLGCDACRSTCKLPCRAVLYNFPLHTSVAQSSRAEQTGAKQGSSAAESPAAAASPAAPALTQLCLLVDVTASKLRRVGRYNLGRVVGRGAFGVVRLGQNTQTGIFANGSCQIAVHDDRLCSCQFHRQLHLVIFAVVTSL